MIESLAPHRDSKVSKIYIFLTNLGIKKPILLVQISVYTAVH